VKIARRSRALVPFTLAVLAHSLALGIVAVSWEPEPWRPVAPAAGVRRVAVPLVIGAPRERAPLPRGPAPLAPDAPDLPPNADTGSVAAPRAEPSGTADDAPSTAGSGWSWKPTEPSSRFTEATLGSVMKDLPPRPDCTFLRLQPFQCLELRADWSLDSSVRVNLNCAAVIAPRRRYAECVRHPVVALDSPPQGLGADTAVDSQ
jgi:hypothetical protein